MAEERLQLIQFFRDGVPHDARHSWDKFCYRVAMPLRAILQAVTTGPFANHVRLTRRRWDMYFLPPFLVAVVVGLEQFVRLRNAKALVIPLSVLPV